MNLNKKINILIVAKPWGGGLQQYYLNAFNRNDKCSAKIVYTYPNTFKDYISYKLNKKIWVQKKIDYINSSNYDLGFFINNERIANKVNNRNNFLYLTDNPNIEKIDTNNITKIFISDAGYISKINNRNKSIEELPFGFDPIIHKVCKFNGEKKPICSMINRDPERGIILESLIKKSIKLDVYGNYFFRDRLYFKKPQMFYPSVSFPNQGKIYSKYLISLNIHASVLKNGTNMRTFEVCGYRLAQIVNNRPGLESFFEPDKEIMVFSNIDEYIYKFNKLIKDKKIYKKMVDSSYKRAFSHHTYDARVKQILFNHTKF